MNGCMVRYATQEEQDAARAEWFATADKRRMEREETERQMAERQKFKREWWDLDIKEKAAKEGGKGS